MSWFNWWSDEKPIENTDVTPKNNKNKAKSKTKKSKIIDTFNDKNVTPIISDDWIDIVDINPDIIPIQSSDIISIQSSDIISIQSSDIISTQSSDIISIQSSDIISNEDITKDINIPPTPPPRSFETYMQPNNDPYLELFYGADKYSSDELLYKYIEIILLDDPIKASKLIFYIRDILGKGCRKPFVAFYEYLIANSDINNHPEYHKFIVNSMFYIADYGYWKDLLRIFSNTKYERTMINIYCKQLKIDEYNKSIGCYISLASKYMPSEKHSFDKKYKLAMKFQNELGLNTRKDYRKYRTSMLTYINVLEQKLCDKNWDAIDFTHVPNRAMQIYNSTFQNNIYLRDRYINYLHNMDENRSKHFINNNYTEDNGFKDELSNSIDIMNKYIDNDRYAPIAECWL